MEEELNMAIKGMAKILGTTVLFCAGTMLQVQGQLFFSMLVPKLIICTWKYVGPECVDEDMYDTYCVYPNRVAMLPRAKGDSEQHM